MNRDEADEQRWKQYTESEAYKIDREILKTTNELNVSIRSLLEAAKSQMGCKLMSDKQNLKSLTGPSAFQYEIHRTNQFEISFPALRDKFKDELAVQSVYIDHPYIYIRWFDMDDFAVHLDELIQNASTGFVYEDCAHQLQCHLKMYDIYANPLRTYEMGLEPLSPPLPIILRYNLHDVRQLEAKFKILSSKVVLHLEHDPEIRKTPFDYNV